MWVEYSAYITCLSVNHSTYLCRVLPNPAHSFYLLLVGLIEIFAFCLFNSKILCFLQRRYVLFFCSVHIVSFYRTVLLSKHFLYFHSFLSVFLWILTLLHLSHTSFEKILPGLRNSTSLNSIPTWNCMESSMAVPSGWDHQQLPAQAWPISTSFRFPFMAFL